MEDRKLELLWPGACTKSKQIVKFSADIYIFDDLLSALDGKVGTFITEETILRELKDKTVILVTHGLQYLKYCDYIYVMDDGKFVTQGKFQEVRQTELYNKFMDLDQVPNPLTP